MPRLSTFVITFCIPLLIGALPAACMPGQTPALMCCGPSNGVACTEGPCLGEGYCPVSCDLDDPMACGDPALVKCEARAGFDSGVCIAQRGVVCDDGRTTDGTDSEGTSTSGQPTTGASDCDPVPPDAQCSALVSECNLVFDDPAVCAQLGESCELERKRLEGDLGDAAVPLCLGLINLCLMQHEKPQCDAAFDLCVCELTH